MHAAFPDIHRIKRLLIAGADPDERNEHHTMLWYFNCTPTLMNWLIAYGADVNAPNTGFLTYPMQMHSHSFKRSRTLFENGAEPLLANINPRAIKRMWAWSTRRRAVMALVMSIPGLSRGMAMRVGWWMVQT